MVLIRAKLSEKVTAILLPVLFFYLVVNAIYLSDRIGPFSPAVFLQELLFL